MLEVESEGVDLSLCGNVLANETRGRALGLKLISTFNFR